MAECEKLYNGIDLPAEWPPRDGVDRSREPIAVPCLSAPPAVIPIDLGRQLFVDDFLIERATLTRTYHSAVIHGASPVFSPETELEMNRGRCPMAAPFNDGVWFDPADEQFKMWYHAGWFDGTALAVSRDGLNWQRPAFDVIAGTNAVIAPQPGHLRDGALVWLDHEVDPSERFKMFLYVRRPDGESAHVHTSADGIHWTEQGRASKCGDNSSFFYNPFRKRFVFSIRESWKGLGRARAYHEHPEFVSAAQWASGDQVDWSRTDKLDLPEERIGDEPQLYDLNAVAYESIMLGAFAVFYGPQNPVCARTGEPKIIDLQLGYSRDGFHWHRPERTAFIPSSRVQGAWDYGYIHASGGLCLVVGDELWFYFAAFSGESPKLKPGETGSFEQDNAMYAGASTGLATLRRDGFASMDAANEQGELVTRPVTFSGKHLFTNVDASVGELRVEILDREGEVIEPFSADRCNPVELDSTKTRVTWYGEGDLARIAGTPVRLRFQLRSGRLYSFWVSASQSGESRGFVAAGGPGFSGPRDI